MRLWCVSTHNLTHIGKPSRDDSSHSQSIQNTESCVCSLSQARTLMASRLVALFQ